MDNKIVTTFCLCDDLLKAIHHQEDRQCQMNDAEIMTTALIAALCFRGNQESARAMLKEYGYIPQMLSKSRFSRRLHRIKALFIIFFDLLGKIWKTLNLNAIYVIDSFPVAVCDNIRIRRSKIYSTEEFRGYQASKHRYFYGLKIHLMVTQDGQPVECFLTPGGFGDVDALKHYAYDLPEDAVIYADKAYNDYEIEDFLKEVNHMHLLPMRKKNSKRALSPSVTFVQHYHRKRVETAGSLIEQQLPKSIHAVTSQGFELKVALFVIASSLHSYVNL
jgi:protein associated with RNAse G/E